MAKNPQDLVRSEILQMQAYHVSPSAGMVKLDAMENPYSLPDAMKAELARRLSEAEINRYPEPSADRLRELIRVKMQVPEGMDVLLGNGSDDLIQMITLALARPGAVMMYPEPTFVMYKLNAIFSGMRPVGVATKPDFTLDCDAFVAEVRRNDPALVYVAYPNNPTGALFNESDVVRLIRATNGLVVLDEAYHVFARTSFMSQLHQFPNLVVMRTVSKLGLAGIRLGYLIGAPGWLTEFNKVRQAYNVNVLTQVAASYVLENINVLEEQADLIRNERAPLHIALSGLPNVSVYPSAANFFLTRVPDAVRTFGLLKSQGVLVRNFHGAHPLLDNCLRITIGTPDENRILLSALREAL